MDASGKAELDIASTCRPAPIFIGNVILHTGAGINFKLYWLDQASETRVILACIFIIGLTVGKYYDIF
jgi:hypothetical protein